MANEKRLIDANALLKEIDGIHQRHYANSSYQFIHDFFLAMFRRIKNAPTVDAVEVVHGRLRKKSLLVALLRNGVMSAPNVDAQYRTGVILASVGTQVKISG